MRTSEFKMDGKGRLLWSLPVERSKNKRARVTPILGLALEIITPYLNYAHNNDILFENEAGKPLYSGLIGQQLLQRLDRLPIARFSTHDLRRTVATMMTAKLSLSLELVAMVVGHTAGGAQTQTLVRHYVHDDFADRKAIGLAQWDRRLRQILAGEARKGGRLAGLTSASKLGNTRLGSAAGACASQCRRADVQTFSYILFIFHHHTIL